MVSVKCLFCDADNDPRATGGYCDSCGKKLPPASSYRSRRISGEGDTAVSSSEPTAALPRRRTAEALFTAAVIWLIGGGLFLVLGPMFFPTVPEHFAPAVMGSTLLGLAVFAILGLGARSQPRLAAITAIVLLVLMTGVGFGLDSSIALRGFVVSVVVLIFLVRALLASSNDREHL